MLCKEDEFENLHMVMEDVIEREAYERKRRVWESFMMCPHIRYGKCPDGKDCKYRHSRGEKSIVCKHWLRGLCKKDENCEFLHMYDMAKLPPCHFFNTFGQCKNPECLFLHLREDGQEIKECPWYARGFCKHGPNCRNKHIRRILCDNYYKKGFCIDGPNCKFGHPKYELPQTNAASNLIPTFCALCGNMGHKANNCTNSVHASHHFSSGQGGHGSGGTSLLMKSQRPLSEVTCFRCGEKGHYANNCTNEKRRPPPGGWSGQNF